MPVHLLPVSRRQFIAASSANFASLRRGLLRLQSISVVVIGFVAWTTPSVGQVDSAEGGVVAAVDVKQVDRAGDWQESRFRFAKTASLQTNEDGAALTFEFEGTGVAVRLGAHNVPAYGSPNLGTIEIAVDGGSEQVIIPRSSPRELTLARSLPAGRHVVRLTHRHDNDRASCRVESFRVWTQPTGDVRLAVSGEENAHLVDCHAILRRGDRVVRNTLVRNWLTGQCSLAGIPTGEDYSLEVRAAGWSTASTGRFAVKAGEVTGLDAIYLRRDPATVTSRFRFPRLNQPAIRRGGETFRARFLGFDATIDEVKLTRTVGSAVVSRVVPFEEDKSKAHYYDREVVVTLPDDMPPGAYDLSVQVTGGRRTGYCRSPRSVHVVSQYPTDPVFVTFGHLDTSAQHQAEYLERLVDVINLLSPDMVLCSNACNPAYVSGALAGLDMPYTINFGNHQFPGHEAWYGDPVGLIDCGPHVSVLNFGHLWYSDRSKANALLASRPKAAVRVINAFESNAPLELLNRHSVRMIHDAHGIGKKVDSYGTTPTRRIGKSNSESFRLVQFRNGHVESCTYNGHETAPIPFPREGVPPLSVAFEYPNDGTHAVNTATVSNRLTEAYPNIRVTFVLLPGKYEIEGGRLESTTLSDDRQYNILTARVDLPAGDTAIVKVERIEAPNDDSRRSSLR